MNYAEFLARKSQLAGDHGFEPLWMPKGIFDFQEHLACYSIRKGRSALLESCGLGKTVQLLTYAENVVRHTNRPALVLTPLAVAPQTVREGEKFGIECHVSRDGKVKPNITVTNYQQLHRFDPDDFGCVIPDEGSAIKAFEGKLRKQVTRFMSKMKYRLLTTATPSPNDFIELGTISEALGEMTQSDMLSVFFKSSDNKRHSLFKEGDFWNRAKYFFKPHSEVPFWRWVCSWARAIRGPEDLGFDGSRFVLPPLTVTQHTIPSTHKWPGEMFPRVARTLKEQRIERQTTMKERCEKVLEIVMSHNRPVICWGQYNGECDLLERMIPGAVQVAGRHSDEEKEERLTGFAMQQFRVLVSKPKIACWGMNYQHCGDQTFFPSHSQEQMHQGMCRSWRFGRLGPVYINVVATEGEAGVTDNLESKRLKNIEMFSKLVYHMNEAQGVQIENKHKQKEEVPAWL